jgi:DNA polymerase-3 subunit epsilon
MLQARMSLVLDPMRAATGYAISLEDISAELQGQQAGSRLHRALTRDLRGPLASLRAAAETLGDTPDMTEADRVSFQRVIGDECARLSEMLEQLSAAAEAHAARQWPLAEVHSPDLLACVAPRLETRCGVRLHHTGSPTWITGDSHQLMMALVQLGAAAAAHAEVTDMEVEAGERDRRGFVELRWRGPPVPEALLGDWLATPLAEAPDTTVREVLERHACEPWSPSLGDGRAALHLPLPVGRAPEDAAGVPARSPELYDFDLMGGASFSEALGERRLKDLSYVVFDTETTGLRPAAGDEIISIAGVRVTKGRVLEGERFVSLVNPARSIPRDSIRFHGITDEQVRDEPPITEVLPRFREFAGEAVLVAHNAAFDMKFIKLKEAQCGLRFDNPVMDTLLLSLLVEGADEDHTLDGICDRLGVHIQDRHSALGDAMATAHVLAHLLERLEARGLHTFRQVMAATNMPEQLRIRGDQF